MTKFYLKDTGKVMEVSAQEWTGSGFKPDCFYEIAVQDLSRFTYNEEEERYEITEKEFTELTEWWDQEFENWKQGFNDAGEDFEPIDMWLIVGR